MLLYEAQVTSSHDVTTQIIQVSVISTTIMHFKLNSLLVISVVYDYIFLFDVYQHCIYSILYLYNIESTICPSIILVQ